MTPWTGERLTFDTYQAYVEELATTEGRLATSALVVLLLGVLGIYVLPMVIRATSRVVRRRLLTEQSRAIVDGINAYIPTTIADITIRTIQVGVMFAGILSLLVIWGLVDVAVAAVRFVGISLPLLAQVVVTLVVFLFAYIALTILEDAVQQYSEGADRITQHQQEIILRMGHVGILIVAIMGALSLWGLNLSGLLVGAGFLGIVLGLAARQTLGAMIAGFVLMFSRPFSIGDWVEIGGEEGIITKITIMQTRLQNFDGESIIIPNDVVANQPITNRSRQGVLRTRVEVGVDYEADVERAEVVALEAIETVEYVESSPPPKVVPTRFGDSAIVLELRFWIENPDPPTRRRATTAVIHEVKTRFEDEDIKIPYPQRELSGRAETDGFQVNNASATPDGKRLEGIEPTPED